MYSHLHSILPLNLVFYLVYRVNFLHARAQKERFHEEKVILESEILWTELSFKNRALIWKQRDMGGRSGLDCYARRQTALWDSMVEHAKEGARTMARSRDVFERGLVETTWFMSHDKSDNLILWPYLSTINFDSLTALFSPFTPISFSTFTLYLRCQNLPTPVKTVQSNLTTFVGKLTRLSEPCLESLPLGPSRGGKLESFWI